MLLEPLVPLDTRELLACLVSVVLPDPPESKERRYVCIQCFTCKKEMYREGKNSFSHRVSYSREKPDTKDLMATLAETDPVYVHCSLF